MATGRRWTSCWSNSSSAPASWTGKYLSGELNVAVPERRAINKRRALKVVNARGNTNGGNAPVVNIINNSSSQVSVKDSHYDSSMRRWILNAVVEDVNNNVDGSATNLKAALGVR